MREPKFEVKELLGIAFTVIVLGIAIAYGLDVIGDTSEDLCDGAGEHYYDGNCYYCNSSHTIWNQTPIGSIECQRASASDNYTAQDGGRVQFNATLDTSTGLLKIPQKMPVILTVVVASVILGVLVTYLWARFQ